MQTPTQEFYSALQHAYAFFNTELFGGKLSDCLITVQREKNIMGYFSHKRWGSMKNGTVHEIALNPAYFAKHPLREVFQTIVHEQCHLWQYEHGKPGRRGYHNKEWADKMESIGLMPSSTGQPGGKRTGEKMSDYCISGGRFEKACYELMKGGFNLPWVDRKPARSEPPVIRGYEASESINQSADEPMAIELDTDLASLLNQPVAELVPDIVPSQELQQAVQQIAQKKQKIKYNCSGCNGNVWGKPNLKILCMSCNQAFEVAE